MNDIYASKILAELKAIRELMETLEKRTAPVVISGGIGSINYDRLSEAL